MNQPAGTPPKPAGGALVGPLFFRDVVRPARRGRGTLDGLLALPVSRAAILRAKWLGSVLRPREVLYLVATALLLT